MFTVVIHATDRNNVTKAWAFPAIDRDGVEWLLAMLNEKAGMLGTITSILLI